MEFLDYVIKEHKEEVQGVYRVKLAPKNGEQIFAFEAGQFCQIKNLNAPRPEHPHSFSIASSPAVREYLELCFKPYGPWTQHFASMNPGEEVLVAGPFGKFTFDDSLENAVFLAGGVGIVPLFSMLQSLAEQHRNPTITLLYGNRTPDQIAFKQELTTLQHQLPLKIVNIYSEVETGTQTDGYTGFITKEIIAQEVDLSKNPTFFLCGPPVFVQLMNALLKEEGIEITRIKQELYSSPPPPKETSSS